MGRIKSGILGRVSGAVGNVVGGSWKGIGYIRERVIPANPRSPAQTANRLALALCTFWSKPLIVPFLRPFMDRRVRRMSGFNFLAQRNFKQFQNISAASEIPNTPNWGNNNLFQMERRFQITKGSLPGFNSHNFNFDNNQITQTFTYRLQTSNLRNTDYVYIVWSDLAGVNASFVQWCRLDGLKQSDPYLVATQTASGVNIVNRPSGAIADFIANTNKILCCVLTMRYNNPDNMDYPINVSRDSNCIFTGSAIPPPPPTLIDTFLDLFNDDWIENWLNRVAPENNGRLLMKNLNETYINEFASLSDLPLTNLYMQLTQLERNLQFTTQQGTFTQNNNSSITSNSLGNAIQIPVNTPDSNIYDIPLAIFIIVKLTENNSERIYVKDETAEIFDDDLIESDYIAGTSYFTLKPYWFRESGIAPYLGTSGKVLVAAIASELTENNDFNPNSKNFTVGTAIFDIATLKSLTSILDPLITAITGTWINTYLAAFAPGANWTEQLFYRNIMLWHTAANLESGAKSSITSTTVSSFVYKGFGSDLRFIEDLVESDLHGWGGGFEWNFTVPTSATDRGTNAKLCLLFVALADIPVVKVVEFNLSSTTLPSGPYQTITNGSNRIYQLSGNWYKQTAFADIRNSGKSVLVNAMVVLGTGNTVGYNAGTCSDSFLVIIPRSEMT